MTVATEPSRIASGPLATNYDAALAVGEARAAASTWAATPLRRRLQVIRSVRQLLGDDPSAVAATVELPWRRSSAETLTTEVLPLLDACRFLERAAPKLLEPERPGGRRRPFWLFGSKLEIRREPLGVVLVIGPSNYPLLLAGVQIVQALAAGNVVVVKPGCGAGRAARFLQSTLDRAGLPDGCLRVLSESVEDARAAIAAGVDKVILTGSSATGRSVLHDLADQTTPATVELSGCDAAIVASDADLTLAARAIAFGMSLNGGFTCIAPHRLLVAESVLPEFLSRLSPRLERVEPVPLSPDLELRLERFLDQVEHHGGRMVVGARPRSGSCVPILLTDVPEAMLSELADLPVPIAGLFAITDDQDALRRIAEFPYRLGLSIFGDPERASVLAHHADVGVVVINDMIVPTADPRIPFGGRGASGFGVTRGAEGLLELTAPKSVVLRGGTFRPHFDPVEESDTRLFATFIRAAHGSSFGLRWRAMLNLVREGRARARRSGTIDR